MRPDAGDPSNHQPASVTNRMKTRLCYKRVLIKLSGEVMAGTQGTGVDPAVLRTLAQEIKELKDLDAEIALVIGGGNLMRGRQAVEYGIERVTADQVGMLTTVINGLAFRDVLEEEGVATAIHSAVQIGEMIPQYVRDRAISDLAERKVIIFVGGLGSPFFTTDTAAALRALEIGAEAFIKATKVDGVYDSDPEKRSEAVKFDHIAYQEVLQRRLRVIDATAVSLCQDNDLPILVFNMGVKGNLRRLILGEKLGTIIGR